MTNRRSRHFQGVLSVGVLIAAVLLLGHRFDQAPAALSNDAAQEIQSGVLLIERSQLRLMTFDPSHNGVETLWVYLMGLTSRLLGPGVLAAMIPSWIAYLLLLIAVGLLAGRLRGRPWMWMLLALSLPWTFHFARSGLRALACAGFTMLALYAFAWFVSSSRHAWKSASATSGSMLKAWALSPMVLGTTIGLSTYVYTAGRAVVIAFFVYCMIESVRQWRVSAGLDQQVRRRVISKRLKPYLRVLVAMFVVLLPWLGLLVIDPSSVVGRGSYNIRADLSTSVEFVLRSIAIPFTYDFDRFMPGSGSDWLFEAVSNQLIAARISPVPIWVGVLVFFGIWRAFAGRSTERAVGRFAIVIVLTTCVLIGFMGPSLSRLMPVAACVIALAGMGLSAVLRGLDRVACGAGRLGGERSKDRGLMASVASNGWKVLIGSSVWPALIGVLLAALTGFGMLRYIDRIDQSTARAELGLIAQPAALRAREHAALGDRVMIFLHKDAELVAYLIHGEPRRRIGSVESFAAPIDLNALPDAVWAMDVFLVEDHPHTRAVIERLRERMREEPHRSWRSEIVASNLIEFHVSD